MKFFYIYELRPDGSEKRLGGYYREAEAINWADRFRNEFEARGVPDDQRSEFEVRYEEYSSDTKKG